MKDDTISRQATIDALDVLCQEHRYKIPGKVETYSQYNEAWQDALDRAEGAIGILPPAQQEPQWIPCSERLPEDLEEVNVTWVNHDPEPYYNFVKDKPFTATAVYYKEKWYWYSITCADFLAEYGGNWYEEIDDGIEIIAWMPMPKPWEGETDEQTKN